MTPQETELLKEAGELFVRDFAYTVPLTLLYGSYLVLGLRAKTRFTWALVALLMTTFIITTIYFCTYIASVFLLMQTALVKNTGLSLSQRFEIASNSILRLSICEMWVGGNNGLLFIFGDSIVVWRAWAVWPERRSIIILPCFLLVTSFAIFLTSSTMRTIAFVNPSVIDPGSLFGNLVIAGFSLSIGNNFLSTVLVGIKAYQHRKFMRQTIGVGSSIAARVLMLLTESGILYIIFQLINICIAYLDDAPLNSSLNIASHVWGVVMALVSALYPTVVILIVHRNQSLLESTESAALSLTSPGTHISFAPSPLKTTTVDTTGSTYDPEAQDDGTGARKDVSHSEKN